eukprot:CAMPEP_0177517374 /NCGR_PEP_ID=MMETSP0369-20130122/45939_1 /TAXON_ID=447022 ORGANISM="Scrippsiella hangoei-like, Strain SHHI-4" /NCGR_SAMPLE_ID=MMETSP0369 /ASSEMBLY_ACC=CAM_ASM_000364 /LENGTH=201 /DNA_ID=CAMNT_0018996373 /DNA_START=71 /DNA_END=675 /DNA_ORIENTATION=-
MAVHAQADARWPLLTQRWTESVCGSTTVDGSSVVDSLVTGTTSCRSFAQSSSLAFAIATPRRQRPRAAPSAPGASSSVASSRAAGSVAVASSAAGRRDGCATTPGAAAAAASAILVAAAGRAVAAHDRWLADDDRLGAQGPAAPLAATELAGRPARARLPQAVQRDQPQAFRPGGTPAQLLLQAQGQGVGFAALGPHEGDV